MRTCFAGATLLAALTMTACGDGTTGTSDLGDLSAVWELSTTIGSNTCGLDDGSTSTDRIILINCSNHVSVIAGPGSWGSGTVQGQRIDITGTEVQTDSTGCRATHSVTGTASGTASLLEGTLATNVTYDPASCGARPACTIQASVRLSAPVRYLSGCLGRDQFGSPVSSQYVLPWPVGKSYTLNNSYCVPTGGHRQQQAYDFLIPIGDTIVASRGGVVRQVKEDSPDNGQGTDHNHVMVAHSDGTVGFYAHLMQGGVLVGVGENVQQGQAIALAGHSGTPDVVHLHFGVYDSYPPVEGEDRAVNFRNMDGPTDCRGGLVNGATYTAQ
jgi:murein DD-endopeptidase MepM/ murein hydrolase activator NlpD